MSLALLLTLASTAGWAAFDAIRKKLVSHMQLIAVGFWINALPALGYALWHWAAPQQLNAEAYALPGALSIALNIVANLLFLYAVRAAPLSLVVPLLSFTPVFAALGAIPLLDEHLLWQQWLGALCVSGGAFFLGQSRHSQEPKSASLKKGVLAMLMVAILWAATPIFDKLAMAESSAPIHGAILTGAQAVFFGSYLLVRGRLVELVPQNRQACLLVGASALSSFFALALQLLAIAMIAVSIFEAVKRALNLGLALASGALFFGEKLSLAKMSGALLMGAGVVLILLYQ